MDENNILFFSKLRTTGQNNQINFIANLKAIFSVRTPCSRKMIKEPYYFSSATKTNNFLLILNAGEKGTSSHAIEEDVEHSCFCKQSSSSSYSQFHQYFTSSLCANFLWPKKYKPKPWVQKSCLKAFWMKKLLIKCWWNRHLLSSHSSCHH